MQLSPAITRSTVLDSSERRTLANIRAGGGVGLPTQHGHAIEGQSPLHPRYLGGAFESCISDTASPHTHVSSLSPLSRTQSVASQRTQVSRCTSDGSPNGGSALQRTQVSRCTSDNGGSDSSTPTSAKGWRTFRDECDNGWSGGTPPGELPATPTVDDLSQTACASHDLLGGHVADVSPPLPEDVKRACFALDHWIARDEPLFRSESSNPSVCESISHWQPALLQPPQGPPPSDENVKRPRIQPPHTWEHTNLSSASLHLAPCQATQHTVCRLTQIDDPTPPAPEHPVWEPTQLEEAAPPSADQPPELEEQPPPVHPHSLLAVPSGAWGEACIQSVAKEVWCISSLKPTQFIAIEALLSHRDVFTVVPTGFGKSVMFQLPPIISRRLSLVISPLLALMVDQVESLRRRGVQAASVGSHRSNKANDETLATLVDDGVLVLYASPEKVAGDFESRGGLYAALSSLYSRGRLGLFAIDEAHCISEWGRDFRPTYRKLGVLRDEFPTVPLIAMTGTATPRVCVDIKGLLFPSPSRHVVELKLSHDRPFVYLECAFRESRAILIGAITASYQKLVSGWFVHAESVTGARPAAIVYCHTRKEVDSISKSLTQAGMEAKGYHAGMGKKARAEVQSAWTEGRVAAIVATSAFGMGIDHPNILLVAHAGIPESLSAYAQEMGRAGRAGQRAHSLILYHPSDGLYTRRHSAKQRSRCAVELTEMREFCAACQVCRRTRLLQHFGEQSSACGNCDVCAPQGRLVLRSAPVAPGLAMQAPVKPRRTKTVSKYPCAKCGYSMALKDGRFGAYRKCTNCGITRNASPKLARRAFTVALCKGRFRKSRMPLSR